MFYSSKTVLCPAQCMNFSLKILTHVNKRPYRLEATMQCKRKSFCSQTELHTPRFCPLATSEVFMPWILLFHEIEILVLI